MIPGWAAGESPLIAARCHRCHRIYAKYWEDTGWVTSKITAAFPAFEDRARVRNLVREPAQACRCDPPPVLPEGDQLAALLERARAHRVPRTLHRHRPAPITIRVR